MEKGGERKTERGMERDPEAVAKSAVYSFYFTAW
jgi:hypothetical protein